MWTPNLNVLLRRTMTLSPSKQRSTNFVPTKSIVIYLAPMLVLKIITSWTRFDLAYNRAVDIWTSNTGFHERRSTFGISRNRQDVRLLSSHIVCNSFFLSFISDVISQLLLCKGDMTLSALCVSKKSAFVHERSLRQFLLEDYYGLRFEEGQLLVRYCSSGCWLDEIWQVFPEITLHIVPDAGHLSSEPGIEKLLVEVCKLDCTFWNTHSLMYIFLSYIGNGFFCQLVTLWSSGCKQIGYPQRVSIQDKWISFQSKFMFLLFKFLVHNGGICNEDILMFNG